MTASSGPKDGELESSSTSANKLPLAISLKSGLVKYGSEKPIWSTGRLAVSQVSIRKFLHLCGELRTIDGIHSSLMVLGIQVVKTSRVSVLRSQKKHPKTVCL